MAKGFKLRLSFPSIRFCRSKIPFVVSPPIFTPLNPKVFDITYPRLPAPPPPPPPPPPPSTPIHPNPSSKITPLGCASKLSPICESSHSKSNADFQKLFNSPSDEELEETTWSSENWDHEPITTELNHQTENDNNHDPLDLTSFSMSFSSVEPDDSSCDFGYSLKTINEAKAYAIKRRKGNPKVYQDDMEEKTRVMETLPEKAEEVMMRTISLTTFEKLMPCMVEGKVNESYAVMKKSEDPYEDFKKSMMEMIMEKQIWEAEDLEKLLMCFLSLNAKDHHPVIVEAFSQVWDELFSKS